MKPLHLGFDATGKPIRISAEDQKTHTHVIGSSGSGKSKFLEWMIRGHIRSGQGFCLIDPHGTLYEAVADYCAHHVIKRDVILLNLSKPSHVIGFNPFKKSNEDDVSVQVDSRITATMHAWNVPSTDQTPTLERMLRLVYTAMLDQGLSLPQVRHLIDFNAQDVRSHLIEQVGSPLIRNEWREIQQLKAADWRAEVLSTKNRLYRLLTSPTLSRFMGLTDRTLNLREIMDEGKILLVNLARSPYLSKPNARVFGALLVNEFFEQALLRRRDQHGTDPKPYHLITDEFANFVSIDLADMLDEVRKFGLFLTMSHQRFGQLDENMIDAMLTNCQIRAVFGGLPTETARMLAQEMFIKKLDPKRIKAAIYQTKFWPKYERDKVYTSGTSHSAGRSQGESFGAGSGFTTSTGEFFAPSDWLSGTVGTGSSTTSGSSSFSFSGSGCSTSESFTESDAVADIPIFVPVPFQELSSIQYYSIDEQLVELTAALKEQFGRHCFIKIRNQETQPMLVPFVKNYYTRKENVRKYKQRMMERHQALTPTEVDDHITTRETALLAAAKLSEQPAQSITSKPAASLIGRKPKTKSARTSIFATLNHDSLNSND